MQKKEFYSVYVNLYNLGAVADSVFWIFDLRESVGNSTGSLFMCHGLTPCGRTYIDEGTYSLKLTKSVSFGSYCKNEGYEIGPIDGHSRILVHTGNTNKDSRGCLLLGELGGVFAGLSDSRKTFEKLYTILRKVTSDGSLPSLIPLFVYDIKKVVKALD